MTVKPYYFIYFLDSDSILGQDDIYIALYPAGYLVIGEGEWPEKGSHIKANAYFSIEDAKEALKLINIVLGGQLSTLKSPPVKHSSV